MLAPRNRSLIVDCATPHSAARPTCVMPLSSSSAINRLQFIAPPISVSRSYSNGWPISTIGKVLSVSYDRTPFGTRLLESRKKRGYTQEQAAAAVGMSQSTLAELEKNGTASGFTAQLATVYAVDGRWLATGDSTAEEAAAHWTEVQHPFGGTKPRGQVARVLSHPMSSDSLPNIAWESLVNSPLPQRFAVLLPDDSMSPFLRAGHQARFSRDEVARPGDCVLVSDSQGAVFARMYRERRPGHWEAHPLNDAYQALDSERDGLKILAVFIGMDGRLG